MKKYLVYLIIALVPCLMSAYDFTSDGLCYEINPDGSTVMLTGTDPDNPYFYQELIIPMEVTHEGNNYAVTDVADSAFCDMEVFLVAIPVSLKHVGRYAFSSCLFMKSMVLYGNGEINVEVGQFSELTNRVNTLYIMNGVTGIHLPQMMPNYVYSYCTVPPACDETVLPRPQVIDLKVPQTSYAAYFTHEFWNRCNNIYSGAEEPLALAFANDTVEVVEGGTVALPVATTPSNIGYDLVINYTIKDPNILSSQSNSVFKGVAPGETDVVASCLNLRTSCHVRVIESATTIRLNKHELTLMPNEMVELVPTIKPHAVEFNAASTNAAVAALRIHNSKVQVVGVSEGEAVIKVATTDGSDAVDSCLVTVCANPVLAEDITLDNDSLRLPKGGSVRLQATLEPATVTNTNLRWISSDENVVTVAQDGTITACDYGTATITARTLDGTELTATCAIEVFVLQGDTNEDGGVDLNDLTSTISILLNKH